MPVKPDVLQTIARASGGQFVAGAQAVDVEAHVLPSSARASGIAARTVEVTSAAAGGGLVFMLAGALLSGVWFRRLV